MKTKNHMTFKFAVLLMLLGVCYHHDANGQTADFSNNWTLQQKTTISGPSYDNGVPKAINITKSEKGLTIERISITGVKSSELLDFSGNIVNSATAANNKKATKVSSGTDNNTFKETSIFSDQQDKVLSTTIEIWNISPNQKTLTLVKTFQSATNPDDKWSMKGLYTKTAKP